MMEAKFNGENVDMTIRSLSLGELVEEYTSWSDDENTQLELEDLWYCPKCGEILVKDENGECVGCNRDIFVDIPKETLDRCKKDNPNAKVLIVNNITGKERVVDICRLKEINL